MAHRSNLLMTPLDQNPVWQEMVQVLESVYGDKADELANKLSLVRDLYKLSDTGKSRSNSEANLFSDFDLPDRKTMIYTCLMLGFNYPDIDNKLFSTESYLRIAQNISSYYRGQGTSAFLGFFAYCMNYTFLITNMWTSDYVTFYEEGDIAIGTPIWKGGTWYPTSHVQLKINTGALGATLDLATLRNFFNYIAPINLVLMGINYFTQLSIPINYQIVGCVRSVQR